MSYIITYSMSCRPLRVCTFDTTLNIYVHTHSCRPLNIEDDTTLNIYVHTRATLDPERKHTTAANATHVYAFQVSVFVYTPHNLFLTYIPDNKMNIPQTEEIRLKTITSVKGSNKFLREFPKIQTSFYVIKRCKNLPGNRVDLEIQIFKV